MLCVVDAVSGGCWCGVNYFAASYACFLGPAFFVEVRVGACALIFRRAVVGATMIAMLRQHVERGSGCHEFVANTSDTTRTLSHWPWNLRRTVLHSRGHHKVQIEKIYPVVLF